MHDASQGQPAAGEEFGKWELKLIRQLVNDFIAARSETARLEPDDLYQECLLHWWHKRERYEDARRASRATFLRRVVKSKIADIERIHRAEKRGGGRQPVPLDAPLRGDDEGGTLADVVAGVIGIEDEIVMVLRIRGATRRLSPRQRRIVGGLQLGRSKTEISKGLHVSRQTLYDDLTRIREVFRDEGLADSLD